MSTSESFPVKSLKNNQLRPQKSLGQNFLVDRNMIGRIVDACCFKNDDSVLEIGPGTGALTRGIIPLVKNYCAVETDRRLYDLLNQEFKTTNATFIRADFLKWDISLLKNQKPVRVIGNLPYYISTPIITRIIEHRDLFSEFFLTIQWELAERMMAKPGQEEYSAFSCFIQFYTNPTLLFKIKKTSFKPIPKVDSCFVRLDLRTHPLFNIENEDFMFRIIRLGFQQRRKTLVNALEGLGTKPELSSLLKTLDIDPATRAERLSLEQFGELSRRLLHARGMNA